jgi:cell division protein FtsW
MQLRQWIPFFDTTAQDWSLEARMIRWLTFVWIAIGLMVMFSASFPAGTTEFKNGWHYLQRHGINLAIGMLFFNWIVHSSLRNILGYAQWGLLLFLSLILLTDLPGYTAIGGAARWIPLGPFLLQPSEFIKPFLVLQSARIFSQWDRLPWKTRLTWLGIFVIALVGILIQPNLSTASLCGMTLWLVALAAGLPSIYLLGTGGGGLLLASLSIGLREYQRKRVMSFLNPWADPAGDGYQLTQSLMAVGSGGIFGTGYGQSAQKMGFLPIQYTDFIIAVFLEEFGLIGGICVLLMLMAYATLGFMIAQKATNITHRLVAIGATVLMVGQSILNIAVSTGAMPTTGLPFPFWSYGGSSVMASCITAALLIRVARESSEVANLPGISTEAPSKVVTFPGTAQPAKFQWLDRFKLPFSRKSTRPPIAQPAEKSTAGRRRRRSR